MLNENVAYVKILDDGKISNLKISNLTRSEEKIALDFSKALECKDERNENNNVFKVLKGHGANQSNKCKVSELNRRSAIAPECQTDMDDLSANPAKLRPRMDSLKGRQEDVYGLTKKQVEAFSEVFNLFDMNGGGSIDSDELEKAFHSVDIKLTQEEIRDILVVIDEDGNGEIDFEEFLHLMTSTEKFLASRDESRNNSQTLLFSALTKFMRKSALSSLTEIERYYHNKDRKSPHVVAHYAAGARLIGLNEKQLAIHLANLRFKYKTGDSDSPYSEPICRLPEEKSRLAMRKRMKGKIRLKIIFHNDNVEEQKTEEEKEKRVNKRIQQTQNFTTGTRNDLPIKLDVKPLARLACVKLSDIERKSPSILTFEDVPLIRKKISEAQKDYQMRIRNKREKLYSQNPHLFDMDVSSVSSSILKFNFSQVLESYGISKGQEVNFTQNMKRRSGPWQTLMRVKYGDVYRSS